MATAELGLQTGDLPSQSVPETHGAPIPDSLLRTKKPLDALSSRPTTLSGWRKAVVAATGAAAAITGTQGLTAPSSAEAFNNIKLYTDGGPKNTDQELIDKYCTPEYIANNPQLAGAPTVGATGETNTLLAEAAGAEPQAVQQPTDSEPRQRVIINFTDKDGTPLSILVPVCPPTGEQTGNITEFPQNPDIARKDFMNGKITFNGDDLFFDPMKSRPIELNIIDAEKTKDSRAFGLMGMVLGVEKRGKDYLVLIGGADNDRKHPFTYIATIDGSFNGDMAYEHLPKSRFELSKVQFGQEAHKIKNVVSDLKDRRGEVIYMEGYIKPLNLGYAFFDNGLAKVVDANDALYDNVLARKKGKNPGNLVGMNIPLSSITNEQIKHLPSIWGIIHQDDPTLAAE